jgi:site-specific DNA recombinase
MEMRAAIYCRVSSERQAADEKVSIDQQLKDCRQYAQDHHYTVVGEYIDKKRYRSKGRLVQPSGERSDRPQYKRLLADAEADHFDVIIAWKQDRLTRGIYSAVPLGKVLEETPITVELVKETFDESMFFIKAAIGKQEIDNIRQRMNMGVKGRLEKGKGWEIHRRYGYAFDEDGDLVVDEEKAQVVRGIFEMYLEGSTTKDIRKALIQAGSPQPEHINGPQKREHQWPLSTLHHILTEPAYYQGYTEASRDGEVYRIPCPPIIRKDTFDQVQELRSHNRSHSKPLVRKDYLCRGLVTCADGRKWGVRTLRYRGNHVLRKTPLRKYVCSKLQSYGRDAVDPDCPGTVGGKKLDQYVWGQIVQLLLEPDRIEKALQDDIDKHKGATDDLEQERDRLVKALQDTDSERQWIITQARKGNISETDMVQQLEYIDSEIEATDRHIKDLQKEIQYRQHNQELSKNLVYEFRMLRDTWGFAFKEAGLEPPEEDETTFEKKRELVLGLVDKIVMHKDWPPTIVFRVDVHNEPDQIRQTER